METNTLYYDESHCLSQWLMIWAAKLVQRLRKTELTPQTLPEIPKTIKYQEELEAMRTYWEEECKRPHPSYLRAVTRVLKGEFFMACLYTTLSQLCTLGRIMTMGSLISWVGDEDAPLYVGLLYLATFGVLGFLAVLTFTRTLIILIFLTAKVKAFTYMLVSEKLFKVSYETLMTGNTSSMVTSLIGTDTELLNLFQLSTPIWSTPVVLILAGVMLWYYLGVGGLVGLAVILVHFILLLTLGKYNMKIRLAISAITDKRIKLTTTLLESIKTVKLYAWEHPLLSRVFRERSREMRQYLKLSILMAFLILLYFGVTGLSTLAALWTHLEIAGSVTVEEAFVVLSILYLSAFLVIGTSTYSLRANFLILSAFSLVTDALTLKEQDPDTKHTQPVAGVHLSKASFSWTDPKNDFANISEKAEPDETVLNEDKERWCLTNVTFQAEPGDFIVVLGPVGSGKTTLLVGILGELHLLTGTCDASSSVAYVPGEAWVVPGTLQENVVLSRPFNPELYKLALKVSELIADVNSLENGDATVVSDRSLSGGQKARLSLARAVYSDADLYLLDDPLSAVDPEVSSRIARQLESLANRGKCIILATHQSQLVHSAKLVVILKEGRQICCGAPDDIEEDCFEITGLSKPAASERSARSDSSTRVVVQQVENVQIEESNYQEVPSSIYAHHLGFAYKFPLVYLPIAILLIVSQMLILAMYYWIAMWSSADDQEESMYLTGFGIIVIATYVLGMLRFFLVFLSLVRAGENLHNTSLSALAQTSTHFFDMHPIGHLLNRFTSDTGIIDDHMMVMYSDGLNLALQMLGYIVLIAVYSPITLIGIAAYIMLAVFVIKVILPLTKKLRLLEITSKSPLISAIHSSVNGILTIRSLGVQSKFMQAIEQATQVNFKAHMSCITSVRFFQYVLELGGLLISIANGISVVVMKGSISPEVAAITLSLTLALNGLSFYASRYVVEVDIYMTSPQRLYDLCELESEPTNHKPFEIREGSIRFDGVSARYAANSPLALKDLTLDIPATSKVGIIGRTGAGKSSILQVLFRMITPVSGTVLIDGQDYQDVGLYQLRQALAVIPQFPLIFYGTVADNIDPVGQYSSQEITEVLKKLQLISLFEDQPQPLDTMLDCDGVVLSAGQKQLICLARALIKRSKIVMMDEATANVDHITDKFIQDTIRSSFTESTLLVIAHRLRTIVDSDLIVVMEDGHCAEKGSPSSLASDPNSIFSQYIRHTGSEEAQFLLNQIK